MPVVRNHERRVGAVLHHDFPHAIAGDARGRFFGRGVAEQGVFIGEGRQGDVGDMVGIDQRLSGRLGVFPQARPVIGVEGHERALTARIADGVQHVLAALRAQDTHGDAGEIDNLAPIEAERQGLRIVAEMAGGGIGAPIGEGAFDTRQRDGIKARTCTCYNRAMGGVDAVFRKERPLLERERIIAEGRDVIDGKIGVGEGAHIPAGVERIAGKSHAPLVATGSRQLNHTLADGCKPAHENLLNMHPVRLIYECDAAVIR